MLQLIKKYTPDEVLTLSEVERRDMINLTIEAIQITDMNGRIIKETKQATNTINTSELKTGVYFLRITTNQGTGTTKIIKT